ncbi:hypothetical protein MMC28_002254 [Mycoblastus sanguinarius]|nr:hypothetical protein [Mycoblastus sanguinarius]
MEPPFKKRWLSRDDNPHFELHERRAQNDLRLKSIFESIFEKYGKDFDGIGDEIDLETGEIVVDNGHILGMTDEKDAGYMEGLNEELGSGCWSDGVDQAAAMDSHKDNETTAAPQGTEDAAALTESEGSWQSDEDADSLMGDAEVEPSVENPNEFSGGNVKIYDEEDELASSELEWLSPKKIRLHVQDPWRLQDHELAPGDGKVIEPAWQAPPLPNPRIVPRREEKAPRISTDEVQDDSDHSLPGTSIWAPEVKRRRTLKQTESHRPHHTLSSLHEASDPYDTPSNSARRIVNGRLAWTLEEENLLRHLKLTTTLTNKEMANNFPRRKWMHVATHWTYMVNREKNGRSFNPIARPEEAKPASSPLITRSSFQKGINLRSHEAVTNAGQKELYISERPLNRPGLEVGNIESNQDETIEELFDDYLDRQNRYAMGFEAETSHPSNVQQANSQDLSPSNRMHAHSRRERSQISTQEDPDGRPAYRDTRLFNLSTLLPNSLSESITPSIAGTVMEGTPNETCLNGLPTNPPNSDQYDLGGLRQISPPSAHTFHSIGNTGHRPSIPTAQESLNGQKYNEHRTDLPRDPSPTKGLEIEEVVATRRKCIERLEQQGFEVVSHGASLKRSEFPQQPVKNKYTHRGSSGPSFPNASPQVHPQHAAILAINPLLREPDALPAAELSAHKKGPTHPLSSEQTLAVGSSPKRHPPGAAMPEAGPILPNSDATAAVEHSAHNRESTIQLPNVQIQATPPTRSNHRMAKPQTPVRSPKLRNQIVAKPPSMQRMVRVEIPVTARFSAPKTNNDSKAESSNDCSDKLFSRNDDGQNQPATPNSQRTWTARSGRIQDGADPGIKASPGLEIPDSQPLDSIPLAALSTNKSGKKRFKSTIANTLSSISVEMLECSDDELSYL